MYVWRKRIRPLWAARGRRQAIDRSPGSVTLLGPFWVGCGVRLLAKLAQSPVPSCLTTDRPGDASLDIRVDTAGLQCLADPTAVTKRQARRVA